MCVFNLHFTYYIHAFVDNKKAMMITSVIIFRVKITGFMLG